MRQTTVIGLGNPGEEYKGTRHNAGAEVVERLRRRFKFSPWKRDRKSGDLVAKGRVGPTAVLLVRPQNFMNSSGKTARFYASGGKNAENLVVIHDDLDLPLGRIKISFGKNSGGHKGVESVLRALGTKNFTRLRFGISQAGADWKIRKPRGSDAVNKFILGRFRPDEKSRFDRAARLAVRAALLIADEGKEKAMNEYNR